MDYCIEWNGKAVPRTCPKRSVVFLNELGTLEAVSAYERGASTRTYRVRSLAGPRLFDLEVSQSIYRFIVDILDA